MSETTAAHREMMAAVKEWPAMSYAAEAYEREKWSAQCFMGIIAARDQRIRDLEREVERLRTVIGPWQQTLDDRADAEKWRGLIKMKADRLFGDADRAKEKDPQP